MTFSVFDHFNVRDVAAVSTHSVADNFNVDATFAGLPEAPTNFTATPLNGGAQLTWTAAVANTSPLTGYVATATMAGGGTLHFTIPVTSTSAILAPLENDETWQIFMYALSSYGGGPTTDTLTVSPTSSDPTFDPLDSSVVAPDEDQPDPPTLDTLVASDESIGVYWTEPLFTGNAALTSYDVEATSADDGVTFTFTIPVIAGTLTGALIGPLTNGLEYSVVVRARNAAGSSADSNTLSGTPSDGLPPILDLPGYQVPPPPEPFREPEPIYWAFPQRHYLRPGNWLLTDAEATEAESA